MLSGTAQLQMQVSGVSMSDKMTIVLTEGEPLYVIGDFRVMKARYFSPEKDAEDDGYAVVWEKDNVIQMVAGAIAQALHFAEQSMTTVTMADAFVESQKKAADTEGLASEGFAFPDDLPLN